MKRIGFALLTAAMAVATAKADNITFADANVKALCVANWDTNNDGELSTDEAAAVTSFGTVFKGNKSITTFDEMRYFTGVTVIDEYAFSESSIGPTLTIPGTVKTIGNYAFYNCQSLTRIRVEEGVGKVGWHSFSGPIAYLSLPSTLTAMSSMAVDPYVNADPNSGIFIPKGDLWAYSYAKAPAAINGEAFYYVKGEGHLIVPPGTIDAYKAVAGWSHFGQYLELGDVNRDGTLDDADLESIISYVDGTEPEGFYADMADINGDGDVDEKDIQLLRNYLYPPTYLLGDTNGDGVVNVQDQINLITYLLGRTTEVFIQEAADVNGDGAIDTLDAIGIIEIILGRR